MVITLRPINDELRRIAREELNENESRVVEDIGALRTWIEKQPHLRACTEDQFLLAFLRGCKFSVEKAKSKIDHYYTIKTMMPEVFASNYMDDKTIDLCRSGIYICLPQPLGPGGPRIQLSNYSKLDTKKYKLIDFFRYQHMLMLHHIHRDDNFIISGHIEVVDLSKMSLGLMTQFDPILVKKLSTFTEKAAPMRNKGVHIINAPREAVAILKFARSLLSEKLQQRFHVHKSLEDFYEHVPREYLPQEYGGSNGCIKDIQDDIEQQLMAFNDVLIAQDRYGVNEKLRSGRKIQPESLFGIEGSFRKLDID